MTPCGFSSAFLSFMPNNENIVSPFTFTQR
jgi:hypothetical protein